MGKRVVAVLLKLIAILFVLSFFFGAFLIIGKENALKQEISGVDLSRIPDGIYEGSYRDYRWTNTVEVTVDDHQIVAIDVVKKQILDYNQVMDTLIGSVIAEQSLDVDAVSGATADSKAYLKAIENALTLQ